MQNFQVISGECKNVTFVQNRLSQTVSLQKMKQVNNNNNNTNRYV